jgi:hypothetical protein
MSLYFNNFVFFETSEKYIEIPYVKRRTETNVKSLRVLTWFGEMLVKYNVLLNGGKAVRVSSSIHLSERVPSASTNTAGNE